MRRIIMGVKKRARVSSGQQTTALFSRSSASAQEPSSSRSKESHGRIIVHEYEGGALRQALLHKRYKRFLADVSLHGEEEEMTIHVPNTGPMTGLLDQLPAQALLSKSSNPNRKYAYTLEWMKDHYNTWVGVHSAKANAMVSRLLASGSLDEHLPIKYTKYNAEVKISSGGTKKGPGSRIDFELINEDSGEVCLVEVKSVTMRVDDHDASTGDVTPMAVFPDTKSERAQRHVQELIDAVTQKNMHAAMVFLIQRNDCSVFSPCFEKDPVYSELVCRAFEAGVRLIPVVVDLFEEESYVSAEQPVRLLPVSLDQNLPVWKNNK
jgi:sugar fermentation stimulation protein A